MTINTYIWKDTDEDTRTRIMRRAQADIEGVVETVRPIIEDVRTRGDAALIEYAATFEKAEITNIKVSEEEFERAEDALDEELKAAIKHCAGNVKKFHEEQMRRVEKPWMVEIEPGVFAGEQVSAIESAGLYVPRGKGAFPSALYMLAIPAVAAGVENIAVVTPPTPEGGVDDATLFTARLCGISDVYKAGGSQAIAALAYGTETVPQVKKVLGPGSPYVTAAKKLCSDVMDPGMPAGPSEAIVLADETADPHNTCLDILNEAEHGKDSAVLLITHSPTLLNYVKSNLGDVITALPEPHREICQHVFGPEGYGGLVLTESLEESITLANTYAAEHLHLKLHPDVIPSVVEGSESSSDSSTPPGQVRGSAGMTNRIKHAGEILIGEHTPSTLGNYGIGVNHVLPTGGWAHTYSCTSVWDFLKRTSISKVTRKGFEALKDPVETLTDYEGFPAHGDVLRKRHM